MEFHVHPFQRLLLMLHTGRGTGQMNGPQAQVVLQAPNLRRRDKARLQQTVRVERRPPLAILHVGLASRQVAGLFAIDHAHFQTRRLQHSIKRQPIDTGGFHRHRLDFALQQPVAQAVQLGGHGAEDLRRSTGDGHMHMFAADIDEGSQRIQNGQGGTHV